MLRVSGIGEGKNVRRIERHDRLSSLAPRLKILHPGELARLLLLERPDTT